MKTGTTNVKTAAVQQMKVLHLHRRRHRQWSWGWHHPHHFREHAGRKVVPREFSPLVASTVRSCPRGSPRSRKGRPAAAQRMCWEPATTRRRRMVAVAVFAPTPLPCLHRPRRHHGCAGADSPLRHALRLRRRRRRRRPRVALPLRPARRRHCCCCCCCCSHRRQAVRRDKWDKSNSRKSAASSEGTPGERHDHTAVFLNQA